MSISERKISRRNVLKLGFIGAGIATAEIIAPGYVRAGVNWLARESGTPQLSETTTSEKVYKPGEIVRIGNPDDRRIYLTVDDCNTTAEVSRFAEIAEAEGVRITFFPVGTNVDRNKTFYADLLTRRFDLENHTWGHPKLAPLSRSEVRSQILRQKNAVLAAASLAGKTDYRQVFLRPPYGNGSSDYEVKTVCRNQGYVIGMWSSDAKGYSAEVDADMVFNKTMADLKPGLVVLLHDNQDDLQAFPRIVQAARERGYAMDKTMRQGIPTTVYSAS